MWRELMRTNLDAVFYVGQAVARRMIPRGKGQIINIASVQSELARTNIAPYTASKGAVKMLTKGMATDWGKHGLRANALAPGYFRTELNRALVEDEKFPRGSPPGRRLAAGATCRSWSVRQSFLHRTRQASSTGMCCT
jgi:gluconate 5-dehydrogenase